MTAVREQILAELARRGKRVGWLAQAAQDAGAAHRTTVYQFLAGDKGMTLDRLEAVLRVAGLALQVGRVSGLAAEHDALVHPDGSPCPDGCDAPPHPDSQR